MSAKFCKQFRTSTHIFIHGIIFSRSSAAFDSLFSPRQHKYRPVIHFPDSSGNQSCNAFVDIRQKQNKYRIILISTFLTEFLCHFHALQCQLLAFLIQINQIPGNLFCLRFLPGLKQPKGMPCRVKSAGCIDTWP